MMTPRFVFSAVIGLLCSRCATSLRTSGDRQQPASSSGPGVLFETPYPKAAFEVGERLRPTVLHFMFELKDKFPHPGIWGEFFESAQPGTLMVWAHCTDYHACKNDYTFELLNVRLVPTTYSVRGADLMTPFVHMIRYALAEPQPPAGVQEKFLVVSDSTLPVKPFSYVYWDLSTFTSSDICISSVNQWAHGSVEGRPAALVKHHQWVALNRSDAAVLARDWTHVEHVGAWDIPLREGRWAGSNRTVPHSQFHGGTWYTATDEEAVWAFLHGPMELRYKGDLEEPMRLFMRRRCHTYVAFPNDVAPSTHLMSPPAALLQLEAEAHSKFDHTKITLQLLKDPDAKLTVAPGIWHPFLMEAVGDQSLRALRSSPYLFARKFAQCAQLGNYSEMILRS